MPGRLALLGGDSREVGGLVLDPGRHVGPGSLLGARQAELGRDAVDAVGRVDILDQHDLEAGSSALARGNGRVG